MPTFPTDRAVTTNVDQPLSDNVAAGITDVKTALDLLNALLDFFTDPGKALVGAADAAAQRSALGLGTAATKNVGTASDEVAAGNHTHVGNQAASDTLAALGGLTMAADKAVYFPDGASAALYTISAFMRSLNGVPDAGAVKSALGLGAAAGAAIGSAGGVQAYSAVLALLAGLTAAANKLPMFSGSNGATTIDVSTKSQTLLAQADNNAWRTELGLGNASTKSIGQSGGVQGWAAILDYIAALGAGLAANRLIWFDTATTAQLATVTPFSIGALAMGSQSAMQTYIGVDTSSYMQFADASATFVTPEEIDAWYTPEVWMRDVAGTYSFTVPQGVKFYFLEIDGAWAGGGGGARKPAGTAAFGGGGSSQPGALRILLPGDVFGVPGTQVTVIVGAKGLGGSRATGNGLDGSNGTDATDTLVGTLFKAIGAKGGKGGTATNGLGGAKDFQAIGHGMGTGCQDNAQGGDSGTKQNSTSPVGSTAGAAYTIVQNNGLVRTGCGSGGSITAANVANPGQNGQGIFNNTIQNHPTQGAVGGAIGQPGATGPIINLSAGDEVQLGGAGGGANTAGPAGKGGVPGGGGGASRDGNAAGDGADGIDGRVRITAFRGGMA